MAGTEPLESWLEPTCLEAYIAEQFNSFRELGESNSFSPRIHHTPMPAAAQSKAWVGGSWVAGIVDSNPTGGMDVCLL